MKKLTLVAIVVLAMTSIVPGNAEAGALDMARTWLTGEVTSLIFSALLALLGGAFAMLFGKMAATFREAGEFMTTLGNAIEDRRITRDELAGIIREGKDVFRLWK